MGQLRRENFGPTESINVTTAVVAGTTAGFTEFEVLGPVQMVTDTVFNAGSVMATGGGSEPDTGTTYPAGFILYKYFTTIHLTSGDVEVVGHKEADEIGIKL